MKGVAVVVVVALAVLLVSAKETAPSRNSCPPGKPYVNCFADPCVVASPPCKVSCTQDYCGGCYAQCSCSGDSDCQSDEWCRPACNGTNFYCTKYQQEGLICEGHVIGCMREKCGAGLTCQFQSGVADIPGVCVNTSVTPCADDSACGENDYCSSVGTCLHGGQCAITEDCNSPSNSWFHVMCVGRPICNGGHCGWICGRGD